MTARGERARATLLASVVASACNGQFDFDTTPLEAGPPIIVVEAGPDGASSTGDGVVDTPRTGVHIACGASICLTSGCCTTSSGASCVDIGEGGTCGGLLIQCDDTDDCPQGQVCCAEGDDPLIDPCPRGDLGGNEPLQRVHCETEAHCRSMNFAILCNPDRPSPCAQCIASSLPGLPSGYHQCAQTP